MAEVSVKIDSNLNKDLQIIAILESRKKEEFISELLRNGLRPYQDRVKTYKFH